MVAADGTVLLSVVANSAVELRLQPAEARRLIDALTTLAAAGEDRQRKLRGADRWVARPGPEEGTYLVRRDRCERVFEAYRVGKCSRPVRCCACREPLHQGAIAYREQDPPRYESPSWREVRLCRRCVEEPVRRRLEEVGGG
jgi:hypothetical protein